jgi:hypothetical protein
VTEHAGALLREWRCQVTLSELAIEAFHPADERTRSALQGGSGSG